MKNIIAIVNFDMGTHATRYIKHYKKPVKQFHLDVKNYGINPTDNILDNLDTNIVHMVLSSNPLTAFKLYTKYPDHVSFCLMDEDCNYTEIENPNIKEVIKLSSGFDMPFDLNSDLDFFDCSVDMVDSTPADDGWLEINAFVLSLENKNVLVVSDLYKLIHSNEYGTNVGFYHIEQPDQQYNLAKQLPNIEYVIFSEKYLDQYEQFEKEVLVNFDINPEAKHLISIVRGDEMYVCYRVKDDE